MSGGVQGLKQLDGNPVVNPTPTPSPTPSPTPEPRTGGDADGDGLSDADEALRGTNPQLADTDGDGVNDGTEVSQGTNPLDPRSYITVNGNRLCTLWTKRRGVSASVILKNGASASIVASLALSDKNGNPVRQGELGLDAQQEKSLSLDSFASGLRISSALFCADYNGPIGTLSGRYTETTGSPKRVAQRAATKPLSELTLKRAGNGSQKLSFSALGSSRDRRPKEAARYSVINLSEQVMQGAIRVSDRRGRIRQSARVAIPSGGFALLSLSLSKLGNAGSIQWIPDENGSAVVTLLDQQLEVEQKKKRVIAKARQIQGKSATELRKERYARRQER